MGHTTNYNILDDVSFKENRQASLSTNPFLKSIRPITSSGLFSPPYNLPLVQLPNHSPISPIGPPILENEVFDSESVFSTPPCDIRPRKAFDVQEENSNVHDWLGALSPEWDTYEQTPTFYKKGFENSLLFSPILEEEHSVRKIQLVSTEQSELSEDSNLFDMAGNQENPEGGGAGTHSEVQKAIDNLERLREKAMYPATK